MYRDRDKRSRQQHFGPQGSEYAETAIAYAEKAIACDATASACDATVIGGAVTAMASPCCSCEGYHRCFRLSLAGDAQRSARE